MRFPGNSIFQHAWRFTASTFEPIHMNFCAIERKFNFWGHQEAIFVKNWFGNIVFARWRKKKQGTGTGFVFQTDVILLYSGFPENEKR